MCPIEKYIKTKRKPSDAKSLFLSLGVISSFNGSFAEAASFFAPTFDAPYPAATTAETISSSVAVPETVIEFVSRFTLHLSTSFSADTAFSTRELHAAQLIPVILYLSVFLTLSLESALFQVYYLQLRRKYTIKVCFSQYPNEIFSVSAENEPFGEQKKTTPATVTQAFVMFLI